MRALLAGASALVFVLLIAGAAEAQHRPAAIRVSADRLLSTADAQYPIAEPHLSTHPTDPDQLFVSALVIKASRQLQRIGATSPVPRVRGRDHGASAAGPAASGVFGRAGGGVNLVGVADPAAHIEELPEEAPARILGAGVRW